MNTAEVPWIKTPLPGPKAQAVLARDQQILSPSYTRVYPLVIRRGCGAVVEDVDGNRFLDFNAGIAVCATGHSHPEVVAAIQRQAGEFLHMSGTDFYYENMAALAEKLAEITPGRFPKRVYLGNSGTEAVEAAMKLARYHTGRSEFIAFLNSFHGRTYGALSLTASKPVQRRRFGPLLPGVHHIPYADCRRCPYHLQYPSCSMYCVEHVLEQMLFKTMVPPEEVAAIIVETVQGEGGYIFPPKDFLPALSRIADKYGILLILDEVQSGMGRTGKFWACQHYDVIPDILITAKGLASGLPLGAVVARADLMNWEPGAHASTFGGNPLACAAALATIRLIEERYLENAARVGDYLLQRLQVIQAQQAGIANVRGLGLMIGIDIVKDRQSLAPDKPRRDRIIQKAFQKGLLVLGCGESSIRLSPPLVITEAEADIALTLLTEAFAAA